eukprot:snap_masked-scaffold_21-processed-gene-5.86-mRNA-1 protein AED:1.00 eAED:1.00 QI:0/-1/0/0/-1/1/1/0/219
MIVAFILTPANIACTWLFLDPYTTKFLEIDRENPIFVVFWIFDYCSFAMTATILYYPIYLTYDGKTKDEVAEQHSQKIHLSELLNDKLGYMLYKRFLAEVFCLEALLFHDAMKEYKSKEVRSKEETDVIMRRYIYPGSFGEINISSVARSRIIEDFKKEQFPTTKNIFSYGEKENIEILDLDLMPKFIISKFFTEYQSGMYSKEKTRRKMTVFNRSIKF